MNLTFLEEGEFTRRGDVVKRVAEELRRQDGSPRKAIGGYVGKLKWDETKKGELGRGRTAEQVLQSGFVTGCTDVALAFIVLARALGIPTRYVETLESAYVMGDREIPIRGHSFTDVLTRNGWRVYEPIQGFNRDNTYTLDGRPYEVVGKGLDFSELYLIDKGEIAEEPIRLLARGEMLRIKGRMKGKNGS